MVKCWRAAQIIPQQTIHGQDRAFPERLKPLHTHFRELAPIQMNTGRDKGLRWNDGFFVDHQLELPCGQTELSLPEGGVDKNVTVVLLESSDPALICTQLAQERRRKFYSDQQEHYPIK